MAVLAKGFDSVLPAEFAHTHARCRRPQQVPRLHLKEFFLDNVTFVLVQQLFNLGFVEVGVDERAVQINCGNELLCPRLL
jgi:hypothetical protein